MRISNPAASRDPDSVNLFDPAFHAAGDPHPVWAQMRASAPLHRQDLPDGRSFLSVTRYHDACRVLGDHRVFTSERGSLLHQLDRGDAAAGRMLVSTDPPRHSELRRPLAGPFGAKQVQMYDKEIRDAVKHVLRPALLNSRWDLAESVAQLPMAVAGSVLGLPARDWSKLSRWTAMAAAPDEPGLCVRTGAATLAIAHHELFQYFAEQAGSREHEPGSLIAHLRTVRPGGRPLSTEEFIYTCYSLLLGANATTPHAVSGTMLALIEHGLPMDVPVGPMIEEGLRWTSPANSFLRYATEDVELSGGVVHKGVAVAVWIGSANRDEEVFADPHRFDIARSDNRHIAFGYGPHYCLGAALARLTLRTFFTEFFRLVRRIELAGPVRYLASHFIAGITRLPVRTTLRESADDE